MKLFIPLAALTLVLAGCATPPAPLPPAARSVTLVPYSSSSVVVREPLLQMSAGRLQLAGYVTKVFEAKTTENTHLDVAFLDASGRMLVQRTTAFTPQRLSTSRRSSFRLGHYGIALDDLPAGTARIEVRAHDGLHSAPAAE